jgi:hypothetical protein
MKLPKFSEIDYKKIFAIAALILALSIAAALLSTKFSKIKVLGVELETTTTKQADPPQRTVPVQPNWNRPNRNRNERTRK